MPIANLRRCSYPGCDVLVPSGRCEVHAVVRDKTQRKASYAYTKRFYDSDLWKRVRAQKLRRDPVCQYCRHAGKLTEASVVDHYTPLAEGGHPTAAENLVSACTPCHNRKTRCEQLGMAYPAYTPSAEHRAALA